MPKILIISADFNLMATLEARLLMDGYAVFTAEDGLLGFQKVQELNPQLIIVDAGLPKMSSHQLIEKVKALPHGLQIPIMIIADRAGVEHLFHRTDISHFFSKPVLPAQFLKKVAAAVASVETVKTAKPKKEEVSSLSSGRGRILLGGPHEFIIKKIQSLFESQGFAVEVVKEDGEVVQKAEAMRPDYVFVQLWEDRSVFNVRKIDKAFVESPTLRTLPFYVFCYAKYATEAHDFIPHEHVIPFSESRDLLVSLEKLLSSERMKPGGPSSSMKQ